VMGVFVLLIYLALLTFWACAVLGVIAAPFVLVWLAVAATVRRIRRRRSRAFAWRPRDWGAEPLAPPELRVSNRERDRAAADLARHWHQGRLSVDELDERVGKALAAKTRAELDLLRVDLP
jgi:uncharacterized protein DUF1707